jgi:hypothetical protein
LTAARHLALGFARNDELLSVAQRSREVDAALIRRLEQPAGRHDGIDDAGPDGHKVEARLGHGTDNVHPGTVIAETVE